MKIETVQYVCDGCGQESDSGPFVHREHRSELLVLTTLLPSKVLARVAVNAILTEPVDGFRRHADLCLACYTNMMRYVGAGLVRAHPEPAEQEPTP